MSKLQKRSPESDTEIKKKKRRAPGATLENVEGQMISLSMNLAKKRLLDGTATSQIILHFLNLGSTNNQLEKEKLKEGNNLLKAKAKSLLSQEEVKVLYANALAAMRSYSGQDGET